MSAHAVLSDLDRTLTGPDLAPDARALDAVARLRARGVPVVIVTGRRLEHLLAHRLHEVATGLVAENGAVLHFPPAVDGHCVAPAFAPRAQRALGPLSESLEWGRAVGSGPRKLAEEISKRLEVEGVPFGVSFNAEEVMLLPPGVDKGSGARAVLRHLGVDPRLAVAVGDADNDVPLFAAVGRGVAVANASREAKRAAAQVTREPYARGFVELAEGLLGEMPD